MAEGRIKPSDGVDAGSNKAKATEPDDNSQSRRRMIKAGLIGAPLILTLKSRPAWGNDPNADGQVSRFSITHSAPPNMNGNG